MPLDLWQNYPIPDDWKTHKLPNDKGLENLQHENDYGLSCYELVCKKIIS